jgi:hypothetical protein
MIKELLSATMKRLAGKSGSSIHKTYLHGALYPKAAYAGTFLTATLAQLQAMDKPITQHIKKVANLPTSFPTHLIYNPLGIGMNKLSDTIPLTNLRLLLKPTDLATGRAIDSILDRHAATTPLYMTDRWITTQTAAPGEWIGSLLEFLHLTGHRLTMPFDFDTNILDMPITHLTPTWTPTPDLPYDRISDIVELKDGLLHIIPPPTPNLWTPHVEGETGALTTPFIPHGTVVYIRRQQFWFLEQEQSLSQGIEILGWSQTHVHGWHWHFPLHRRHRRARTVTITRGDKITIPWTTLRQCNRKGLLGKIIENKSILLSYCPLQVHNRPPRISPPLFPGLCLIQGDIICSDGSYAVTRTGPFPHQSLVTAGAAVVVVTPTKALRPTPLRTTAYAHAHGRAFIQELTGVIISGAMIQQAGTTTSIHTDCKSLLAVQSNVTSKKEYSQMSPLLQGLDIQWVKSHSDVNTSYLNQSNAQFGNTMADRVADGRLPSSPIDGGLILAEIARKSKTWILLDPNSHLSLTNIRVANTDLLLRKYLAKRSIDYNSSWTPEGLQVLLAKKGLTIRQRGARLKLFLSRYDRDRLARAHISDPTLPPPKACACGCLNTLETWLSTCMDAPTKNRIQLAHHTILDVILLTYPQLRRIFAGILSSPSAIGIWRCNWSADQLRMLETAYADRQLTDLEWRSETKAIMAATEALISAALDLHGLRNEKTPFVRTHNPGTRGGAAKTERAKIDAIARQCHQVKHYYPSAPPPTPNLHQDLYPTPPGDPGRRTKETYTLDHHYPTHYPTALQK